MATKVGKLIKEARVGADLTQEKLARKISGLSANDISLAERGEKELTQAQLKAIAKACGVGVGTVYNYFPSKDDLLAAYMLQDWRECMAAIAAVGDNTDTPADVLRCMHGQLLAYADRHRGVFRDQAAAAGFAGSFGRYHGMLRAQLAVPVRKFCSSDFASEFVAEAILTWTMAGKPFEEVYELVEKLF